MDARRGEGARPARGARHDPRAGARAGGEQDAWAPFESVQEVYELLGGHKRFRSYPHGRHSVFRDAPEAYEDMRIFLDDIQALEMRS